MVLRLEKGQVVRAVKVIERGNILLWARTSGELQVKLKLSIREFCTGLDSVRKEAVDLLEVVVGIKNKRRT